MCYKDVLTAISQALNIALPHHVVAMANSDLDSDSPKLSAAFCMSANSRQLVPSYSSDTSAWRCIMAHKTCAVTTIIALLSDSPYVADPKQTQLEVAATTPLALALN